ncbi:MAG TPA: hypothetical protein VNZ64_14395 [Candidatus Acidoferrum sp.]|jgi:hypothetical protein|nr:hypothetical protein [Candidatus Acidoferrum sp.]
MKSVVGLFICIVLVGCGPPPPVPKGTHVKQVQQAIARGGGATNILTESRALFARLSMETNYVLDEIAGSKWCDGLTGITNLGDVFHYDPSNPDYIRVRIHNSHFDTYFIDLLNPDLPEPAGFERIAGNVGFIEPGGAANRSQPVRPETNQPSAAAGSGR